MLTTNRPTMLDYIRFYWLTCYALTLAVYTSEGRKAMKAGNLASMVPGLNDLADRIIPR